MDERYIGIPGGWLTVAPWGLGTSIIRDADLCALRDDIDAALRGEEAP